MAEPLKTCLFLHCSRGSASKDGGRRGYCRTHYLRLLRHGDPFKTKKTTYSDRLCDIGGCEQKVKSKGYCSKHYKRLCRNGDPTHLSVGEKGAGFEWLKERSNYSGDDCLIYPGKLSYGYARLVINGIKTYGHRWMCEQINGAPPHDKPFALHSCGQGHKGCVNPRHLYWGTQKDNMRDRSMHGTTMRGSSHCRAKLTENSVREIRRDIKKNRKNHDIADQHGVSPSTISSIKCEKSWSWLT